jgi:hypothetical protein
MLNLAKITENMISQLIYDQKSFTAYDVTLSLRNANSFMDIKHDTVRSMVNSYMSDGRLGYRSKVIEVSKNVWATQYYCVSPSRKPPVTAVVPLVLGTFGDNKVVPGSTGNGAAVQTTTSTPAKHILKVTYDAQERIYISKKELASHKILPGTKFVHFTTDIGHVLDFSVDTQKSLPPKAKIVQVSSRGYIRFKSLKAASNCVLESTKVVIPFH